tara:strand:+ start:40100 stop:40678 length:579 start_codon:yes stop_codon:yes gene_type:complete
MNFEKYVYIDPTSPTGLRWRVEGGRGVSKHYVNDVAGVIQQNQSYRIWLEGKFYKVHRIIYEVVNGWIPEGCVIDHIDGNPFNNHIDNLRAVSRKVNSRNMKRNKFNKTGYNGVSIDQKTENYTYAVAQWRDLSGKHKSKAFSFLKYGEELAIFLAAEYRQQQIDLLNLQGAGYTCNHGEQRQLIPNNYKAG